MQESYSARDIGRMLGISEQYSYQVMKDAGIKLGITSPLNETDTGNIGGRRIYYTPATEGNPASWFTCDMGYGAVFQYRYFMEHSLLHVGDVQSFGYNVTYQWDVSEKDLEHEVVIS